jgi:hypothetical protein
MGLSHDMDPSEALVRVVGTGALTMPQMIAAVDRAAEDPRFHSDFAVVFDIRAGDYVPELDDGQAFAAALGRREEAFQGQFALVVPEHLHFLARLYCVVAEVAGVDRMKAFTDIDEALAWCRQPQAGTG